MNQRKRPNLFDKTVYGNLKFFEAEWRASARTPILFPLRTDQNAFVSRKSPSKQFKMDAIVDYMMFRVTL